MGPSPSLGPGRAPTPHLAPHPAIQQVARNLKKNKNYIFCPCPENGKAVTCRNTHRSGKRWPARALRLIFSHQRLLPATPRADGTHRPQNTLVLCKARASCSWDNSSASPDSSGNCLYTTPSQGSNLESDDGRLRAHIGRGLGDRDRKAPQRGDHLRGPQECAGKSAKNAQERGESKI